MQANPIAQGCKVITKDISGIYEVEPLGFPCVATEQGKRIYPNPKEIMLEKTEVLKEYFQITRQEINKDSH